MAQQVFDVQAALIASGAQVSRLRTLSTIVSSLLQNITRPTI